MNKRPSFFKAQIVLLHGELTQEGIAKQREDAIRASLDELQLEQEQLEQSISLCESPTRKISHDLIQ